MSGEAQPRFAVSRVDGTPIFYDVVEPSAERGNGDGSATGSQLLTVVMSDGIGCDGYVWKHLRRALTRSYRLIHWHYPGHGRSPKPSAPEHLRIPALADDVQRVLDDAGVANAILCGHSMGVQVSLETYRQAPARVQALVLMCGSPENPLRTFRSDIQVEALLPKIRTLAERTPWLFNRMSRKLLPTRLAYEIATLIEPNEALLDRRDFMPYLEGMSRVDIRLFLDLATGACAHSAVDLLPDIKVPSLVVGGKDDGFTPPEISERMHAAIPGSELYLVQNGSHTAPIERPDEVNQIVLDFFARHLGDDGPKT